MTTGAILRVPARGPVICFYGITQLELERVQQEQHSAGNEAMDEGIYAAGQKSGSIESFQRTKAKPYWSYGITDCKSFHKEKNCICQTTIEMSHGLGFGFLG